MSLAGMERNQNLDRQGNYCPLIIVLVLRARGTSILIDDRNKPAAGLLVCPINELDE